MEVDPRTNLIGRVQDTHGRKVLEYLSAHVDTGGESTVFLDTGSQLNIEGLDGDSVEAIVNLKQANDIRALNEFLAIANQRLPLSGIFVLVVETYQQRKTRLRAKFSKLVSAFYLPFDFLVKRVFPKLSLTKKIYHFITADRNRAMSLTETLGRLVYAGFEIVDTREINNLTYVVTRKIGVPCDDPEPDTGFLLHLPRRGNGGETITVYKLRTMHPYAQYIQEYLYEKNKLESGGKIKNDFRIAHWGRILRRLMIDEFPMLFNVLRGDVKLFGIRPLSDQYLSLYPQELQERRKAYKPGFLPPYHADMPNSFEEILQSEVKYLEAYDQYPLWTDIRYFFRALYNIFIRGASSSRSKEEK